MQNWQRKIYRVTSKTRFNMQIMQQGSAHKASTISFIIWLIGVAGVTYGRRSRQIEAALIDFAACKMHVHINAHMSYINIISYLQALFTSVRGHSCWSANFWLRLIACIFTLNLVLPCYLGLEKKGCKGTWESASLKCNEQLCWSKLLMHACCGNPITYSIVHMHCLSAETLELASRISGNAIWLWN